MILATYINDLLYRYDCVIVPDFGGFVTNRVGEVPDFTCRNIRFKLNLNLCSTSKVDSIVKALSNDH